MSISCMRCNAVGYRSYFEMGQVPVYIPSPPCRPDLAHHLLPMHAHVRARQHDTHAHTQPAKIRLCCDKLSSAEEVEEVLTHELIHAYDVRFYMAQYHVSVSCALRCGAVCVRVCACRVMCSVACVGV
jgi:hypothetical protein